MERFSARTASRQVLRSARRRATYVLASGATRRCVIASDGTRNV